MKIFRIVFGVFLVIILLAVGFVAWFCTGSFVYQYSMQEEFVVDEPITVVFSRAMNIKPKPKSEDKISAKIDMQDAAEKCLVGQPIDVELDVPKFGTINATLKIDLEEKPNPLKIRGTVILLDPHQVKKFGKTLADVENLTFTLKISAKDETGKDMETMDIVSGSVNKIIPDPVKKFIPDPIKKIMPDSIQKFVDTDSELDSSKTGLVLSFDSDVRVCFREMGFLRSQVDQMAENFHQEIIQEIEKFLDENLRTPTEEELARQKAEAEKAQRMKNRKNGILNRRKKSSTESQNNETDESETQEETDTIMDEDVDTSLLNLDF